MGINYIPKTRIKTKMDSFLLQFMTVQTDCGTEMGALYVQLCTSAALSSWMPASLASSFLGLVHHCFRFSLPTGNPYGVVALSVSVPPDQNNGVNQWVYETALVGVNGHLVYNEALGYEDVRTFYSRNDVANELTRVLNLCL